MKTLILAFVTLLAFNTLNAQSLDQIIESHVKAVGGADNWKKVNSMVVDITMQAQGAEVKVKRTQVNDKAMRMDISVMGMNGYTIVTKTEGWNFMPFQGQTKPEPMTEDVVKATQDDLNIMDDFMTYKTTGKKLELVGTDDVEGTECFKITSTNKDGKVTTYWLDKSSYLIIKEVQKLKVNGQEMEQTSTYSNYKTLPEGINYPHSVGGDWGEMEVKAVVINSKIEDSIFKPAP